MLREQLAGAKRVNLKKIGGEHFTPEFIRQKGSELLAAAQMCERLGGMVRYDPDEYEKCIVHHVTRALIHDLWEFSAPTIKNFIDEEGRFSIEAAQRLGGLDQVADDFNSNLDSGREFVVTLMNGLLREWVDNLGERNKRDSSDAMSNMYLLYRAHSILINGGNWDSASILELTFSSAGRERFEWLNEYPNLSRAELEQIVSDSHEEPLALASGLGIKSAAREQIMRRAEDRGQYSFVFDPENRKIIFNPELQSEVDQEEQTLKPMYYDQTELLLMCPAKFVPSILYAKGNMLNDLGRFRDSIFVELYLAMHKRG